MPNYRLEAVARVPQRRSPPQLVSIGELVYGNLSIDTSINNIDRLQTSFSVDNIIDPIKARLRDLRRFPTELWLYREDELIFQGPLSGGQIQGNTLNVYCHGFLYYLKYMYVTSDLTFTQLEQFDIVSRLISHWQNQDWGNFGIVTSGNGKSGRNRKREYVAAENPNIHHLIDNLTGNVDGFDYSADHKNRRIQLDYPNRGSDKTDLAIFDRRNVTSTDIQMSVQVDDIASDAYGTGTSRNAEGEERIVRSHQFNEDVRRTFGKTGVVDTFDGVSRQTTADNHTAKLLQNRDEMLFVPGPELRPIGGVNFFDFDLGDKITYSYNAGLGLQTIQRRVLTKSLKVSENGIESLSVELA